MYILFNHESWLDKHNHFSKNLQEIKNLYFSSVFWRFLSPGWSDWALVFCSVSGILRHKFRVPTKGTLKTKIFWPTKGVWLSSEARSQTKMHKNYFFKAVNPIPIYRHMEFYSKLGQFWHFCFFSTPYCPLPIHIMALGGRFPTIGGYQWGGGVICHLHICSCFYFWVCLFLGCNFWASSNFWVVSTFGIIFII